MAQGIEAGSAGWGDPGQKLRSVNGGKWAEKSVVVAD
jgi:hypothetical protein